MRPCWCWGIDDGVRAFNAIVQYRSNTFISFGLLLVGFNLQAQNADFIVQAAREAHAGLKTFAAEGAVTTRIDLTATPAGKAARAEGFKGGQLGADSAFVKPQTRASRVSLKLRRDGRYRIEWEQQVGRSFTNKGAAWNAGEGDRIQIPEKGVGRAPDKETCLHAASGFSGGASVVFPSLFYGFDADSFAALEGLIRLPDEDVNAIPCHVIGGRLAGQNVIFWIRKSDYLIQRRKQILGGGGPPALTDEEARKLLKESGVEPVPAAIGKLKKEGEQQRETVRATQGHVILTLTKIAANSPISDEAFQPANGAR